MAYGLRCGHCGKELVWNGPLPETPPVCIACGTRITTPPEEIDERPAAANGASQLIAQHAATTPTTPPVTNPSPTNARPLALGSSKARIACAMLLGATLLFIAGWWSGRAWSGHAMQAQAESERTVIHRRMLSLKSEAESLAIAGRLEESHARYRELQRIAMRDDTNDPTLRDMIERARIDQQNVYTMLLRRKDPSLALEDTSTNADGSPIASATGHPGEQSPYFKDYNEEDKTTPAGGASQTGRESTADSLVPAGSTLGQGRGGVDDARRVAPSTSQPAFTVNLPATRPSIAGSTPSQLTGAAPATQPIARAIAAEQITDDQIGIAIQRGVNYLMSKLTNGELPPAPGEEEVRRQGLDALCVYSLLEASQAIDDPRLRNRGPTMAAMIDRLKSYSMSTDPTGPFTPVTYARSLRAAALAASDRPEDRKALQADVNWLVAAEVNGAYTYDDRYSAMRKMFTGPRADRNNQRSANSAFAATPSDTAAASPSTQLLPLESAGTSHAWVIPVDGSRDPRKGQDAPTRSAPPQATQQPRGPTATPSRQYWVPPTPYLPQTNVPNAPAPAFPWDNSNSQYALLGVWSAAEAGAEVPHQYWKDVERHWLNCELRTAEWGYRREDFVGSLSMTCGGIASLMVTHEYLQAPGLGASVGREIYPRPLAAALAWVEAGGHAVNTPNPGTQYMGYDVYAIERVGLASGFKYLGTHDWYRELGYHIVKMQWPNGAWGASQDEPDNVIDTAYMLLFLSRGRHPILMNKARFDGSWSNRPRDIANLARYASHETERALNWQVVSLDRDWRGWMDSPILYIASHKPPQLKPEELAKLRQFVEAGGLIFTHADANSEPFTRWVEQTLTPALGPYPLKTLDADDPLYSLHYPIARPHPKLMGISNGSRWLLIHSPTDLAVHWQQRSEKIHREIYRLGLNLFFYAAGTGDLRNRLNSPYIPDPPPARAPAVRVARLKYAGNWDPEPYAWTRMGRYIQTHDGAPVRTDVVELKDLKPDTAPFADLTGTAGYSFSEAEVAALRGYVEAGGTLLVDSCGGSTGFAKSVQVLLGSAFPNSVPHDLIAPTTGTSAAQPNGPALSPGAAANDSKARSGEPRLRPFAAEALQGSPPHIQVINAGKGAIIVSSLDLTTAMLGAHTYSILGYTPESAIPFVEQLLLSKR